jgi:hypothetical protein
MQPIPETGLHELVWTQPRAGTPAYELYAGEDQVATLRWQQGSTAEACAAGGQWTFERGGGWHPHVTVRVAGSDADLATFTTHWTGTGTLECAGGHRFQWRAEDIWRRHWAWQDDDGTPLLRIGAPPKTERGGRTSTGLVELTLKAGTLTELPLLVLLGWYLVVLHTQDVAAAAAAGSTTAATYVAISH